MALVSVIQMMWKDIFCDLYLIAKIMIFPLFVIFTLLLIPFSIVVFFVVDILGIILFALSKNMSVRDYFDFFID